MLGISALGVPRELGDRCKEPARTSTQGWEQKALTRMCLHSGSSEHKLRRWSYVEDVLTSSLPSPSSGPQAPSPAHVEGSIDSLMIQSQPLIKITTAPCILCDPANS